MQANWKTGVLTFCLGPSVASAYAMLECVPVHNTGMLISSEVTGPPIAVKFVSVVVPQNYGTSASLSVTFSSDP